MSIQKLKRVMLRLRAQFPDADRVKRDDLKRAIMIECGTSPMTYYNNMKAMVKLGWIRRINTMFRFTGKDLTEDYEYY